MEVDNKDLSALIFYALRSSNTSNPAITRDMSEMIFKYKDALSKEDIVVMQQDIGKFVDGGKRGSNLWCDLVAAL